MVPAILHGLIGFNLQLLPCAFFCVYPFLDSFRYSRKRTIAVSIGIIAVMSAVFTCLYTAADIPSGKYSSYLPLNLIFLLTVFLLTAVYLFCIRAEMIHKFFTVTLVLNYGFLVSYISQWFLEDVYLYDGGVLISLSLATAVLFFPMLRLMRFARNAFDSGIEQNVWKWFTLIPGIFFAALLLFFQIPVSVGWPSDRIFSVFMRSMSILMLIVCAVILRMMREVRRQAEEYTSMKTAVNTYKLMAKSTDKEREMRHEFHHHMAALSILLRNRDYDGAVSYLDKISQVNVDANARIYTPHVLLNSILSEYEERAREAGIAAEYSIQVPNPVYMDDLDLCQFISNMLDNALDANLHLSADVRRFSLTIRQTGNFLFFLCENPCDPARLRPEYNGFGTEKSNESWHGYGIPLMRRIAEKYNGIFRAEIRDSIFTVTANLCTAPPQHERKSVNVLHRNL